MPKILIIDDNSETNQMLTSVVGEMGHDVANAATLQEGLKKVFSENFDIVLLDVHLPDGNGIIEALPKIREADSTPEVIIITGHSDPDGAEEAIKNGAWDYIIKPSFVKNMPRVLKRALDYRKEKKANKLPIALKREGIIGNSSKFNAMTG